MLEGRAANAAFIPKSEMIVDANNNFSFIDFIDFIF
jgi:hypothetical protein